MTHNDRLSLLKKAVSDHSQADIARKIGRSAAAINQVLKGTYAGNPDTILELVAAHYGGDTVTCPVMGEVRLSQCLESRNRPFSATNSMRVRLFKACRLCPQNSSQK